MKNVNYNLQGVNITYTQKTTIYMYKPWRCSNATVTGYVQNDVNYDKMTMFFKNKTPINAQHNTFSILKSLVGKVIFHHTTTCS